MGFQLTSMSRVFLFPGKPDTVGMMFLTGTVFQETGEKTKAGDPPEDFTKVVLPGTAVEGQLTPELIGALQKAPDPTP